MAETINWNSAIHYASLVRIAESVRPEGGYGQPQIDEIKAAGYTLLQTAYGDDLSTDIDPHLGDVVTFGFLALSDSGELVAAIRGTDTILEWLHDAEFLMVPSPVSEGLTEDGFTAIYKSLRIAPAAEGVKLIEAIKTIKTIKAASPSGKFSSITICGHSLGGALATLLSLDVAKSVPGTPVSCYTFASPRTGDHVFADEYKKSDITSFRVANRLDLVTMLPPILPLPYDHVEGRYELKPELKKLNLTIPCMHHLADYLWLMEQLTGGNTFQIASGCAVS